MKIIITESQLNFLIKESSTIDDLLDKINQVGYENLTDEEKYKLVKLSKGEEEPESDTEYKEELDPYNLFMHYALENEEFEVNGKRYHTEKVEETDGEHLRVIGYDDEMYIYVTPFWMGKNGVSVITLKGKKYLYKLKEVPKTESEMQSFITNFYTEILPEIITKLS